MRPALVLALLLGVGVPVRAADPAAELGARLSEQATAFLAQLLGPGRGRALVSVQAEKRETHTTRELSAPMPELSVTSLTGASKSDLPGYSNGELKDANAAAKAALPFITTRDNVMATSDLIIKKISVTVVLDKSVTPAQVAQVKELLPQFLQMDGDRGDDLNVVMAPLRPAWKDAMEGPDGLRTLMIAAALLLCTLIIVFVAYIAVTRAVNVMSAELAARRPSQTAINLNSPWGALPGGGGGSLEGELLPGGLPSLTGEAMPGGLGDNPALGRRFDFLTSRKPDELARLLGAEAPEDLAQLFAYLATTNPDLASSLFGAIPAPSQSAVSQILVTMSMADPERLASIESRLKTLAEYGVQGTDRLGKILSRLPAEQREGLIGEIVSSSPDAAAEIERSLFPFEDIATLKPADLRRLLSSVPYDEWGFALRGSSKDVVDTILKQLPAGARESVAEALEQPSARARVQEARSKILSQLQALSSKGQVDLGRDAELI